MEPASLPKQLPAAERTLEGQLRECFGRVVYSHKTHEKCADLLVTRLSRIKIAQIVLSAATTGGFLAAVFGAGETGALMGVVVSTLLLTLNAYTKNYDLGELAQKHKQAASDLWLIREKYLSLITDLHTGSHALPEVRTQRDQLLEELHSAYSGAPGTTFEAYKKAQKALQTLEDMTFADREIDAFLPEELRRSGRSSELGGSSA